MSRLTLDGTAEIVSRDQILRRERGQGNTHFPRSADHEQIGNLTGLIHALAICVTIHYRYCRSIQSYYNKYYCRSIHTVYYNNYRRSIQSITTGTVDQYITRSTKYSFSLFS